MKVKELIEHLQKMDPEAEVYTAIDDEGNGFRQLFYAPSPGRVNPQEEHRPESFYDDDWSDEDCCLEPGERETFIKAICIG